MNSVRGVFLYCLVVLLSTGSVVAIKEYICFNWYYKENVSANRNY